MLCTADAVSFVDSLPASSVDLVVTDPAYESLEKHRSVGITTRLTNEWFPIFPNERFEALFRGLYRALKPNTHCYVMCDQETAFTIAVAAGKRAGFTFWKALIWDKVAMGMGYHYRAQHELVLFFEKGSRQLADLGVPDVLSFKRVRDGYPTEKPEALCRVLVEQSSSTGGVVLDPFMGSASTGAAAISVVRNFIGCDVVEATRAAAVERLTAAGGELVEQRPQELLTLV
jgi:site-specific DNA-methyltransferase (adenine-specific)